MNSRDDQPTLSVPEGAREEPTEEKTPAEPVKPRRRGSPTDKPLAEPPKSPPSAPPQGTRVGRYVLLKVVGQGGMGVVYAAYDPELDRQVALKLVLSEGTAADETRQARLLREAQAMARVSHPNVLPVFDAGTWEGQVFIAMELLDGGTLHEWLKQEERPWRQVVERFIAAGRGLEAAHAAGLVHRDFKPTNVLLGRDGRVCVMDFGLARHVGTDWEDDTPDVEGPTTPPRKERAGSMTLTVPGLVMGTPAYMPPEQYWGEADPRSDQFSFCAALYRALYRKRPFNPKQMVEALSSKELGPPGTPSLSPPAPRTGDTGLRLLIQEPPRQVPVPARVRRALMKGLSLQASERFPTMDALLEALAREQRRTRRWWVALGVGSAVGLGVAVAGVAVHQRAQVCAGAQGLMAEAWSPEAKQRAQAALVATGRPFAPEVARTVTRVLDGYASDWVRQRTEACEATRLRGEQTESLLSLRVVCLERRRKEVGALARLLAEVDGKGVERAVEAAHALPSLQECADVEALATQQPLPEAPARRAEVERLLGQLAEVRMLRESGRYAKALERVRALESQVRATAWLPLQAEQHLYQGWLRWTVGEREEALRDLALAVREADAGRADRLRLVALTRLLVMHGMREQPELASVWSQQAEAALARLGGEPLLEGELLASQGNLALVQDRYQEAQERLEKAHALQAKVLPVEHPRRTEVTFNLGLVARRLEQPERAVALLSEALRQGEAALGRAHPSLARYRAVLAMALRDAGKPEQALVQAQESVALRKATFGPEHPFVADALDELGMCLLALGRHAEALEVYQSTLAIRQKAALEPEDEAFQPTYDGIGQALLGLGRVAEAVTTLEKALAFPQAEADSLGETGFALARALWESGPGSRPRALQEAATARSRLAQVGWLKRAAEVEAWVKAHSR